MKDFNQLHEYAEIDTEKRKLMRRLEMQSRLQMENMSLKAEIGGNDYLDEDECCYDQDVSDDHRLSSPDRKYASKIEFSKVCPKCGRRFPESENFCYECLASLKTFTGKVSIKDIKTNPVFASQGTSETDSILTGENFDLIDEFDFTIDDFFQITHSIKAQAYRNLDNLIKDNEIDLDELDILDKVLLFAKSFVNVEYKSYGQDLGYFEFNKILVDDRQRKSLQITTIIHELTHFLIKEILLQITCKILDVAKTKHIESVVVYILSNSILNRLIDEYAAHSVEGRFTIFGYQDYSSFVALQDEIDREHVDIAKTIGNTFSIHIKEILEGFLDWDLREEIKDQFLEDTIEGPDYRQLAFESCSKLSDEGFLKAIWLILTEGFKNIDIDVLNSYMKEF